MPTVVKRVPLATAIAYATLQQVFWFAAAGLFISLLTLTYGLDLSPGLF